MENERSGWAEVIYKRREAFDMTQQQLADAAGVSLKTISNIENDESLTPQRGTLRKVREALGLSDDLATAQVQAERSIDETDLQVGPQTVGKLEALDELKTWMDNMGTLVAGPPPRSALWIFNDLQLVDEIRERVEFKGKLLIRLAKAESRRRGPALRSVSDLDASLGAVANEGDIEGSGEEQ